MKTVDPVRDSNHVHSERQPDALPLTN